MTPENKGNISENSLFHPQRVSNHEEKASAPKCAYPKQTYAPNVKYPEQLRLTFDEEIDSFSSMNHKFTSSLTNSLKLICSLCLQWPPRVPYDDLHGTGDHGTWGL